MKRIISIALVVILVLACSISVTACKKGAINTEKPYYSVAPKQFESEAEVKEVVEKYQSYFANDYSGDILYRLSSCNGCFGCGLSSKSADESSGGYGIYYEESAVQMAKNSLSSVTPTSQEADYSKTNVQVDGMDEGDIVKTDGSYIYYLSNAGLVILSAGDSGEGSKVYGEKYDNFEPSEMYVLGNQLIVIGHQYEEFTYYGGSYKGCWYFRGNSSVTIRFYDISNPTEASIVRTIKISGSLNTTRLYEGYLYLISEYGFGYGTEEDYIPTVTDTANGEEKQKLSISDMYYFEGIQCYSYQILAKIKVEDSGEALYKAYLGAGSTIYVSKYNIYAAITDYYDTYYIDEYGYWERNYDKPEHTRIAKFALDSLDFKAVGKVEGYLNDRFSMDEYEGNLRVATSTSCGGDYNSVFVLNGDMSVIGTATNIAPGERIYSARFSGTVGNIVTYRQMDPLFKIDLSEPTNPKVSEGLEKDGVSYYLQYVDGTDLLIGLGVGTEGAVSDGTIEVSLFDNSGAQNTLINRISIGGENVTAYTDAYYNPHEILYDKEHDLFAFPVETYDYSGSRTVWTRDYYVFGFTDGTLKLRAVLSNYVDRDFIEMQNGDYDYLAMNWKAIERGVRIGNYVYTLSNAKMVSYSLTDFAKVSETFISSAEYNDDGNIDIIVSK